jgi:hypothetical protein
MDDNLKFNLVNRGVNHILYIILSIHFHLDQFATRLLQCRNFFREESVESANFVTKLLFKFTHFFNNLLNF